MEAYKAKIDKAMGTIERDLGLLLKDKADLAVEVERLNAENIKLKDLTKSALEKLDRYIKELEDIRKSHVSSNNSN